MLILVLQLISIIRSIQSVNNLLILVLVLPLFKIDTYTVTVLPEIAEHLFYLMQWLQIGGTNHLIFFDRGANAHLVQGNVAVAAGF